MWAEWAEGLGPRAHRVLQGFYGVRAWGLCLFVNSLNKNCRQGAGCECRRRDVFSHLRIMKCSSFAYAMILHCFFWLTSEFWGRTNPKPFPKDLWWALRISTVVRIGNPGAESYLL